jgi:hypothetical protein
MSKITKLLFGVFLMIPLIGAVGCGSDQSATDTEATEGPEMPPPEQPGTPAPDPGDQSALPTEGEPGGPTTNTAATEPAESQQVALPTEGDPIGEPQPLDTAPATSAADQAKAAKIEANLAALSAEDRAIALKQKICPVGGEPLGAMGPPIKVSIAGHEVFICCEGCEKPLVNDPAKHLAKIGLTPADDSTNSAELLQLPALDS